jgi:flagellar basal body-associated protein FliL
MRRYTQKKLNQTAILIISIIVLIVVIILGEKGII